MDIGRKKSLSSCILQSMLNQRSIISFRVTKGNVHDSKEFSSMIREVSKEYDIDKVYADKAHDNRRSFNLLDDLNIEPAINIRKNASTIKSKVCPLRVAEVGLIKKLGYDGWKQLRIQGRRWIAEIVFSSTKESIR